MKQGQQVHLCLFKKLKFSAFLFTSSLNEILQMFEQLEKRMVSTFQMKGFYKMKLKRRYSTKSAAVVSFILLFLIIFQRILVLGQASSENLYP